MLGNLYTEISRDSWTNTPDNSMQLEYDSNGNPLTIAYYQGENVVFIKSFTYNSDGKPTKIKCTTPPQN